MSCGLACWGSVGGSKRSNSQSINQFTMFNVQYTYMMAVVQGGCATIQMKSTEQYFHMVL